MCAKDDFNIFVRDDFDLKFALTVDRVHSQVSTKFEDFTAF